MGEKIEWSKGNGARHVNCSSDNATGPTKKSGPSIKQIDYALSLARKVTQEDYGAATTYGWHRLTRSDLEKMSSRDVSTLIDQIKKEV